MDPEGRVTHRVSEGRLIITSPLRYRAAERKSVAVRNREDRKCVTRSNQPKFERSNVMASGGDQNHLPISLAVSISVKTLDFLVGFRSDHGHKISENFRSCEAALTTSDFSDRIRLQNFRSCEAALNASHFEAAKFPKLFSNVSISVRTLDFLIGFRSGNGHGLSESFRSSLTASDYKTFRSCQAAPNASEFVANSQGFGSRRELSLLYPRPPV